MQSWFGATWTAWRHGTLGRTLQPSTDNTVAMRLASVKARIKCATQTVPALVERANWNGEHARPTSLLNSLARPLRHQPAERRSGDTPEAFRTYTRLGLQRITHTNVQFSGARIELHTGTCFSTDAGQHTFLWRSTFLQASSVGTRCPVSARGPEFRGTLHRSPPSGARATATSPRATHGKRVAGVVT